MTVLAEQVASVIGGAISCIFTVLFVGCGFLLHPVYFVPAICWAVIAYFLLTHAEGLSGADS